MECFPCNSILTVSDFFIVAGSNCGRKFAPQFSRISVLRSTLQFRPLSKTDFPPVSINVLFCFVFPTCVPYPLVVLCLGSDIGLSISHQIA